MKKIFDWLGAIAYLAALIYLVFFLKRRVAADAVLMRSYLNLVPFRNRVHQLTGTGFSYVVLKDFAEDFFGNIMMFLPLPYFLIRLSIAKSLRGILLIACCMSLSIEITQYVLGIGIADVNDVLLNTLGAYLGYLLLYEIRKKSGLTLKI